MLLNSVRVIVCFCMCSVFYQIAGACSYSEPNVEELYKKSDYVYSAVVTGVHLLDFENRLLDERDNFSQDVVIESGYDTVELTLFADEKYKMLLGAVAVPKKVLSSYCGSGYPELEDRAVFFVTKKMGQYHSYAIIEKDDDSEMRYDEAIENLEKLAGRKQKNVPGKRIFIEDVAEVFENMAGYAPGAGQEKDWIYSFSNRDFDILKEAKKKLLNQGYELLDIEKDEYGDDKVPFYIMRLVKKGAHTIQSMDKLNDAMYRFAHEMQLDSYDGFDFK